MNKEVQDSDNAECNNNYIIDEPLDFEPEEHGLGYMYFTSMKRYKNNIAQVAKYPKKGNGFKYLVNPEQEDTYEDILKRSIRTALELRKRNLEKVDVVALCTYNHRNSTLPFIASIFLGVKVASLDPVLSLMDTSYLLLEVKPKIIFVVPEALATIDKALEETGLEAEIVIYDELGASEGHTNFSDFLRVHEDEDEFTPERVSNLKETAVIFFSSGTTGYPKGIEAHHFGLICQAIILFKSGNLSSTSINYSTLYWISGVLVLTAATFVGASRVICRSFDPKQFWYLLDRYKITNIIMGPSQVTDIIKVGRPDGLDTTNFTSVIVGGSSISRKNILHFRDLLPGTFVAMAYGQTEVSGMITSFSIKKVKHALALHHKPESVGFLTPGMMAKVVDMETEKLCGPHQQGELRVNSPFTMNGYYGRDASESFDADGWLRTGDVVYYDEERCFYVVDRIKEMLKYKYWHVAPAMVEKIVLDHPAVQRVVVIGIPHEEDGDHPMAVIILNPDFSDTVTEEDIQDYVAEKAPDRMRLRGGVRFVSTIPVTPSGKIKRKTIRDMVLNGTF